jgi:hypothetical protein
MARSSVRRSVLVATRMTGTESQKCETSGYHCAHPLPWSAWFLPPSSKKKKEREKGKAHLVLNILQTHWEIHRETDEQNVRFGVTQWAETVVFFLSGGVPQGEFDDLRGIGSVEDAG